MSETNTQSSRQKIQNSILRRASNLAEQGLYEEACEAIREGERLSPHDPTWSVRLADIYRAQKRMGAAIEAMQQAVELDPCNSAVQEQLLRILLDMGRYDEAIELSRRLIERSPRNVFARDILGIAYLHRGMLDQALRVTDELIRIDPTDSCHYFKKAVLLQQKGEVASALEAFLRSLEMDPDGEMADDAREAIASLDTYQLRQILTIAVDDAVFRTKLALDPDGTVAERGFRLSPSGMAALRQIDLSELSGQPQSMLYH